jgi:PAP2 superfamily
LGVSTIANYEGNYSFSNINLKEGKNKLTIVASDVFGNKQNVKTTLFKETEDKSGIIVDWNDTLLKAIAIDRTAPPRASRAMAMMGVSVYDAVNSITDLGQKYLVNLNAPAGASAEAAAAEAAYQTLKALFPNQTALFDTTLARSLSKITDGAAENNGREVGRTVAAQILSSRQNDGSTTVITYQPSTAADGWRSTANPVAPPVLPNWPGVKPFALNTGSQFRPDGPPDIRSAQFQAELAEVRSLGSINSTTRTADQTEIALFWADGPGSFTPPGHWNQIAQGIATEKHNTLQENARLFALVNIAVADAGIAAWDAKYAYNQFRPIQGIRFGANDGSSVPWSLDPSWTPLLGTPNFPDYISGHSTFSAAGSTVLATLYGDNVAFSTTSPLAELAGVSRSFNSFSQAADEAGRSRIYGGIHWESSNQDGLSVGRKIGSYVVNNFLVA